MEEPALMPNQPEHSRIPGAVILGGDYQGLGIARSLGRKGIPICVIDDENSISRYSRYTKHWIPVASLREEEAIIRELKSAAERYSLDGWVLFPTRDEIVAAISNHRDELCKLYRVPTPGWDVIQWIWDKRNTYKIAAKFNIPIPETWVPSSVDNLKTITTPFPLALKPAIKEHFFYATKAKAWRADNPEELQEQFERAVDIAGPGEILIQNLIPGDGRHQFGYCAFFKDGKAIGSMVSRRRRQHPHEFGRASTYVETIDLPALEELSEKLLRGLNYYGLVEVEYKLDARDGQFKLLDINARTWGYHTLGSSAGVDFPYMLYLDQIGKPVDLLRATPGTSWIRFLTDLPTAVIEIWRGRLKVGDYLSSLWHSDTEAVFSFSDPMPGVVECLLLPYFIVKRGF